MPADYVDLMLCRDVFHCRPSELMQEDATDIIKALACLEAENYIHEAENKARNGRNKATGGMRQQHGR